jgi:GDP-4-dehydro-6-deoxy-D-mannose reductase
VSSQATLLLLGSTGFVGGHLRAAAEAGGVRVIGTSRDGAGAELGCELTDRGSVTDAIRSSSPDLVVNMAGQASVAESWDRPAETFAVNATGVVNLLEAVAAQAPAAHVTCVSSADAYGAAGDQPFREQDPLAPLNPYGAAKAAMEAVCGQYARARGLEIAVIRAFNQLGPGQSPKFVASDFARQVAEAELAGSDTARLSVGDISIARDFTDVRDSARAYLTVAQQRLAGTFNLCSQRAVKLEALIEEIRKATPLTVVTEQNRSRPADAPLIVGSAEKLRKATGWSASIPLEQTVADLLGWWRSELGGEQRLEAAPGTGTGS